MLVPVVRVNDGFKEMYKIINQNKLSTFLPNGH